MNEPRFASLGPSLLARKGGARPAMRPQLQPLHQFHENTARQFGDDLGWNDMGYDVAPPEMEPVRQAAAPLAEVVALNPQTSQPEAELGPENVRPAVLEQRQSLAALVAVPAKAAKSVAARLAGRRAAFTLRLDSERHLKLRLACTLTNRSAQNLVTEALDRLLDELPDLTDLATQVRNKQ